MARKDRDGKRKTTLKTDFLLPQFAAVFFVGWCLNRTLYSFFYVRSLRSGLLLSVVTKVTKNTLFLRERADPKQLCFAELVSGPTSSFAAIKALLNPTKETVWVITFPFFVCDTLQFAPYSLEKIDSLSFCTKPRLEKQLLYALTM